MGRNVIVLLTASKLTAERGIERILQMLNRLSIWASATKQVLEADEYRALPFILTQARSFLCSCGGIGRNRP